MIKPESTEEWLARIDKRVNDTMWARSHLKPMYVLRAMWLDLKAALGYGRPVKRVSLTPPFEVEYK